MALAALGGIGASRSGRALAAPAELGLSADTPAHVYDFAGIAGWTTVSGQWTVEEPADSPSGRKVLVQRATRNEFNVVVAPGRFTDVDVSVMFKPRPTGASNLVTQPHGRGSSTGVSSSSRGSPGSSRGTRASRAAHRIDMYPSRHGLARRVGRARAGRR